MSGVAQKPMCDLRPGDVFESSNGRTYRVVKEPEKSPSYYSNTPDDGYGPEIKILVSDVQPNIGLEAGEQHYYYAPAKEEVSLVPDSGMIA